MFAKIGWIVTWLAAPLAALAALGVFNALEDGDIHLTDVLSATLIVLWICLVWAVSRMIMGRPRAVHVTGCAILAVGFIGLSNLPRQSVKPVVEDAVSVSLVQPQKAK